MDLFIVEGITFYTDQVYNCDQDMINIYRCSWKSSCPLLYIFFSPYHFSCAHRKIFSFTDVIHIYLKVLNVKGPKSKCTHQAHRKYYFSTRGIFKSSFFDILTSVCLLGADTIFSFLAVTGPYQPNILMQYQYLSNKAYIIFDMPKIHNKNFFIFRPRWNLVAISLINIQKWRKFPKFIWLTTLCECERKNWNHKPIF